MKYNALLLATLFGLAACGGSDSPKNPDTPPGPEEPEVPEDSEWITFNLEGATTLLTTTNTGTHSSFSQNASLLKIDREGNPESAIESPLEPQFSFTVAAPSGNYVYAVITEEDRWHGDNYEFIQKTNCAIYKVSTASSQSSCADEGYIVSNLYGQKEIEQNTARAAKSLQVDADDNVVYYGKRLDDSNNALRLITSGENKSRAISSDVGSINSFILMRNHSLVYSGNSQLMLISGIDTDNVSSVQLNDSYYSSYNVDDDITAIFSESDKLIAGQPSRVYEGGRDTRQIAEMLPSSSKIIVGDDGFLYAGNAQQVHQVLPAKKDPIWQNGSSHGNNDKFQIERGYLYLVDSESHGAYGARDNFVMTHVYSGEVTRLLSGSDNWHELRVRIADWRLSDDILFFTGFNQANSRMVWGEVDTYAMRQGKPESEYLTLRESDSNADDVDDIRDMEILPRPQPPENEGGRPRITEFVTDIENIHNASVEFSKWMNTQSVFENSRTFNAETYEEVDALHVWFGRNLHLIYDLNPQDPETVHPLEWSTKYTLQFDENILDLDGFRLGDTNAPREHSFKTRPEFGWYIGTTGFVIDGITDGSVAKLRTPEYNHDEKHALLSEVLPEHYVYEWSSRYNDEFTLSIRNAYQLSQDAVESHSYWVDVDGREWNAQAVSHYDSEQNLYVERYKHDEEIWPGQTLRELTKLPMLDSEWSPGSEDYVATWVPYHQLEIFTSERFYDKWDNGSNYLISLDSGEVYLHVPFRQVDPDDHDTDVRWVDDCYYRISDGLPTRDCQVENIDEHYLDSNNQRHKFSLQYQAEAWRNINDYSLIDVSLDSWPVAEGYFYHHDINQSGTVNLKAMIDEVLGDKSAQSVQEAYPVVQDSWELRKEYPDDAIVPSEEWSQATGVLGVVVKYDQACLLNQRSAYNARELPCNVELENDDYWKDAFVAREERAESVYQSWVKHRLIVRPGSAEESLDVHYEVIDPEEKVLLAIETTSYPLFDETKRDQRSWNSDHITIDWHIKGDMYNSTEIDRLRLYNKDTNETIIEQDFNLDQLIKQHINR